MVGFVLVPVLILITSGTTRGVPSFPLHSSIAIAAGTNCTVGNSPQFPAYDPANRLIYVPNRLSSNVSVINGTCGSVGSVALPSGSRPWAAAYNPLNRDIYVTDASLSLVYVVHNLTLVHSLHKSAFSLGTSAIAWDPSAKLMLCATGWGNLVGISGTTINGSTNNIGGAFSYSMAYDSRANEILVVHPSAGNVTGVNASHPFSGPHVNVLIKHQPVVIASDPATGYDYVTDSLRSNVYVINGSGGFLGVIKVGKGPGGVAVDPAKQEVFVANSGSHNISVIKGLVVVRTIALGPSNYVWGFAYDSSTRLMYATGWIGTSYKVFIVT
ncbi:MAG TPA: YncE family protein [Nitrospira sp.]|nr:YncE family protein [Nitrospira sp.]